VACLLEILQTVGALPQVDDDPILDPQHETTATLEFRRADTKRQELAVYLRRRRGLNPEAEGQVRFTSHPIHITALSLNVTMPYLDCCLHSDKIFL
jgi:hypothetical protein